MKSFFFSWCVAVLCIGCSKMETEDKPVVEQPSTMQENSPTSLADTSGSSENDPANQQADFLKTLSRPDAPQSLRLQWADGKRYVYEITIDQVTSAGDSPFAAAMDSKADQQFTYALTANKHADDGTTQLEMKFLGAKLNLDMMGNKLTYDSENPDADASIDPMYSMLAGLDALMGQTLSMTLNPDGQIASVEGVEEMYEKVIQALPKEAKSVAQGIVQEDQFKQLIQYPFLPESAVQAGGSWKRTFTQVFGINGAMDIDNTYTYLGQAEQDGMHLNVLQYEGSVVTGDAQNDEMMGMQLSMEGGKNTGVIKLDQVSGHIVESDAAQEMTMVMRIPESMQAALPEPPKISIQMTQKIRLKEVSDAASATQ